MKKSKSGVGALVIVVGILFMMVGLSVLKVNKKPLPPSYDVLQNFLNLESAEPGDFIRWKNGHLTLISRVADQIVWIKNPRNQQEHFGYPIKDVVDEIKFVCRQKVDPFIWGRLCPEYVRGIINPLTLPKTTFPGKMPAPTSQPDK